jgi:hypothetical protein
MQDTKEVIKGQIGPAPAQETKKVEEHKRRFDRRLEKRKKELLEKLVKEFFEIRSTYSDPDGEEVAKEFDRLDGLWKT